MDKLVKQLYPIYVIQGRSPDEFKAGFIDAEGRIAIDPCFEDARPFSEGLSTVKLGGKWGAIDTTGTVIIPCAYEELGPGFSEGKISYYSHNRLGILTRDGAVLVPAKYLSISDFKEGAAYVSDGKLYGFVDDHGKEFIPRFFEDVREFSDGLAPAKLEGKWGYIDQKASFVIAAKFDFALPFSDGLARVAVGGRWGPFGFINRTGELAIPVQYGTAYSFREGLAAASRLNEKVSGYIDKSGRFVIPPAYGYVMSFSEGLAGVNPIDQRMRHFIGQNGERAFAGDYLGTHPFENQRSLVSTVDKLAYIDTEGRKVWEGPYVRAF